MRATILAAMLFLLPALALGGESRPDRPHWSLELKGGAFFPDAAGWDDFYGKGYLGEYGAAISYKVTRQLELGIEGSYARGAGKGQLSGHAQAGSAQESDARVTHEQLPLNLFVLARGVFEENQWLVPYAGGGYTRMFYRQKVEGQEKREGSVNGYHLRGGVQLLLDRLEPETAENLYGEFGMHNTYFFLEGRYMSADADTVPAGSVDLGGVSYLGGFLFEF